MQLSSYLAGALLAMTAMAGPSRKGSYDGPRCQKLREVPFASDIAETPFAKAYSAVRLGSGPTYRYVHIKPKANKPYLLFFHGFPSSAYDWRHQITYFADKGYGIMAPDLLGYGGTDRPTDPSAYRVKKMVGELVELLDCERIDTVYGIGHDHGLSPLSRFGHYYPDRIRSYAFLDIGYVAPNSGFTRAALDAINANLGPQLGYEPFGYWSFFAQPTAGPLMDAHRESAFDLVYAADSPTLWRTDFAPKGAVEAWLNADRRTAVGTWITEQDRRVHTAMFKSSGYTAPLLWYDAEYEGFNLEDNKSIPPGRDIIPRPVLLVTAALDPIGLPATAEAVTRPYAPDLRVQSIEAGHWVQLEKADETNQALDAFFTEVLDKEGKKGY